MKRRLKKFRELNYHPSGSPSAWEFFSDLDTEILYLNTFKDEEVLLESMKIYI